MKPIRIQGDERAVTLSVTVGDPNPIHDELRVTWSALISAVGEADAPDIIFLALFLGILDDDPSPSFFSESYSSYDMFGGCDRDWTVRTRRASIHRKEKQEINESWQHVDVDADFCIVSGLGSELFIDWDGSYGSGIGLKVGELSRSKADAVVKLCGTLFKSVKIDEIEALPHAKILSELKREYEYVGAEPAPGASADRPLLVSLLADHDADIAFASLKRLTLGNLLDRDDTRAELSALLPKTIARVRAAIIQAMGYTGNKSNELLFLRALRDTDPSVREKACSAIGMLGPDAGEEIVIALCSVFRDPDPNVRSSAVTALVRVAGTQFSLIIEKTVPLLKDAHPNVRGVTIYALSQIRDPRLVPVFLQSLADESEYVRSIALESLGTLGDSRALPAIEKLRADKNEGIRLFAADIIARLKRNAAATSPDHLEGEKGAM
jgi:hypothetical protein